MRSKNVSQGWVGYSEAQRLTGFGRPALRKLVKNGRLRATIVNRETRFDKYVLEAFVENHPTQLHLPGFEETDGLAESLEKGPHEHDRAEQRSFSTERVGTIEGGGSQCSLATRTHDS